MSRLSLVCAGLLALGSCSDETGAPPGQDRGPADLGVTDRPLFPDQGPPLDLAPADLAPAPDLAPDQGPPADASQCASPCDCDQGLLCQNGTCVVGTKPVYCCSKPGCPTGQPCVNPNGSSATCPASTACTTTCNCPQGQSCQNGQCVNTTPPTYCCTKPCPVGLGCVNPNGTKGTCTGVGICANDCDCTQGLLCAGGLCIPGFVPVYCCPKLGCPTGQSCTNPDGSKGTCP